MLKATLGSNIRQVAPRRPVVRKTRAPKEAVMRAWRIIYALSCPRFSGWVLKPWENGDLW